MVVAIILGALNTIIHFKSPFIAVFCNIGQSALKGAQEGRISLWYFSNFLPTGTYTYYFYFILSMAKSHEYSRYVLSSMLKRALIRPIFNLF